uniref:Polyprotein n=2 Tax=Chrysanthemum virus B TaxID=12165 RepID=A6Q0U1_CVB|nr:polyprotein [Chrysanthemum virus B]
MALTYRSPMEENVGAYDSSVQAAIASTSANYHREAEVSNFQFFNYYLRPIAKRHLIEAGIYLSPYSAVPHSHAACKTLENHLLYNVLPPLVDNRFHFVGIKQSKLEFLKLRNSKLSTISKINRFVTSADKARYGSDFVKKVSKPHVGFKRHELQVETPTLRDLLPCLKEREAKYLFLHDELHYWSKEDLISLLEVLQPEMMLGTMVYPPELLFGSNRSLNPWCYAYEVKKKNFLFYPDGVRSEGYEQPLNGGYLLECGKITLVGGTVYKVDILCSKFAHHLVSITRGEAAGPTMRSFGPFEATACNGLDPLTRDVSCSFPIPYEVVSKVYRYLKTLRKPDEQSSMAKLTQLLPCPTGEEIVFVQEFSNLVIATNTVKTMISADRLKIFMGKYLSKLPKILAERFETVKEISLHEFIKNLEPFTVDVQLKELKWNNVWTLELKDDGLADEFLDPVRMIEERFGRGEYVAVPDRTSAGYYLAKPSLAKLRGPLIEIEQRVLRITLAAICYKSLSNSDGTIASINEIAAFFRMICAKPFLRPAKYKVYDLYGEGGAIGLQKYMRSRWAHHVRFYWANIGLLWFRSNYKFYQKFLTAQPDGHGTYKSLMHPWSKVMHEVTNHQFHSSKTSNYSWLRCERSTDKPTETCGVHGGARPEAVGGGRKKAESKGSAGGEDPKSDQGEGKAQGEERPVDEAAHGEWPFHRPQAYFNEEKGCTHGGSAPCSVVLSIRNDGATRLHKFPNAGPAQNRYAGFYSKNGVGYSYNGGEHQSLNWPGWISVWMRLVGIPEIYNCCLVQRYDENAKIGMHSDDEECFVTGGPIYTVNIEGRATFMTTCKEGKTKEITSFELGPGDLFEMPGGFQETHKHAVFETSKDRLSVTFRLMKQICQDEQKDHEETDTSGGKKAGEAEETEQPNTEKENPDEEGAGNEEGEHGSSNSRNKEREQGNDGSDCTNTAESGAEAFTRHFNGCKVSVHAEKLPYTYNTTDCGGNGNCFWLDLANELGLCPFRGKKLALEYDLGSAGANETARSCAGEGVYAVDEAIACAASVFSVAIKIYQPELSVMTVFEPTKGERVIYLELSGEHFRLMRIINGCVVKAMASALNRKESEVMHVIEENCDPMMVTSLWNGEGVDLGVFHSLLELFSIKALIFEGSREVLYNREGRFEASFEIKGDHIEHVHRKKGACNALFEECGKTHEVKAESLELLNRAGTLLNYESTLARARRLADSLCSGTTGVVSSSLFNKKPNLFPVQFREKNESLSRDVLAVIGTLGSGKSTILKNFFKINLGRKVLYVSPRRALLNEFQRGVCGCSRNQEERKAARKKGQENWDFMTFETFILKCSNLPSGMAVVLDEIQLYPPGYLDMICYLTKKGVHLIVAGDPCQSDYDNERDRAWLSTMRSDVEQLLDGQSYKFNVQSHRFKNENFRGRLPCEMIESGSVEMLSEEHLLYTGCEELVQIMEEYSRVFLVSSFDEKKIIETHFPMDEQRKVYTFGESTGVSFRVGTIIITDVSAATSEKHWLTALSRFSENICFVNLLNTDWNGLFELYKHRALGHFLSQRAQLKDLLDHLPGQPQLQSGLSRLIGRDAGKRKEKLIGGPLLKCMIVLGRGEDAQEVYLLEEVMQEDLIVTRLHETVLEGVRARGGIKIMSNEAREVRMGDIVSEQFTDDYPKDLGVNLTNAAERFETIYPRHRASDTVTFIMAVKKRLRFSRPAVERAKLQEAKLYGKFLLNEFLKKIPLKQAHNAAMMERAKFDFEEKKTSKSAATIENHAGRSCRDWLIDVGLIFSKSQLCTKFDNRFRVAKAAQSIVCFQHAVLCRFAPYMRYNEAKLHEVLPSRFYIHSGKGLEELNEWVIKGKFEGICTESDYEAFDASQDQYVVAFELALMEYLGLPRDLIEDYAFIKCHFGSKLGNFAIMRFSGEASTFLFNTMANMLFTFLRYNIRDNEHICFAGDDMCASERLCIKKEHEGFLNKLKLKAKVFFVDKPTFCGWHLCPDGIYKKPQLVLERMCIAKEKNNLANCLDNYAIEVSYAYKLGERAVNRMDEEELEAAYNCVRIIIKNKKLLKSDILGFYSNIEKQI